MNHISGDQASFAEVLLPLAIPQTYTYSIPIGMEDQLKFGIRVEVPIKNKLYSGLVIEVHQRKPAVRTRHIVSVLDSSPVIYEQQFKLWKWMADYYCAYLGEVMYVAMPSALKLSSETRLVAVINSGWEEMDLSDDEHLIAEAITIQQELTIGIIQDILNKKTVYPVIKSLMEKRVVVIKEEIQEKYFKKKEDFLSLLSPYDQDIQAALSICERSDKQGRALLALYSLSRKHKYVSRKMVYEMAGIDSSVINALVKKDIIEVFSKEVSRIALESTDLVKQEANLSPAQLTAKEKIEAGFSANKPVLLHGITGSGKTQVYVELIKECLAKGGQVLYLLPEIALTSQIVERLQQQMGDSLYIYHSKVNDQKRVEVWQAAMTANRLFVGARSAIFLPFSDLRLIIVDEEHDPSYKQEQPNPKYNGRDAALVMGQIYKAHVILGSATPSLESYRNASVGKYVIVQLLERYGSAQLPHIEMINMKVAFQKGLAVDNFSTRLIEDIREVLSRGEQVILFQNRRGYAPILKCEFCGWTAECPNCDVTLTYHQAIRELKCHYCGYRTKKSENCPACGHHMLKLLGIGTEKIEELIQVHVPKARIARFDHDTTRSKKNLDQILMSFENGEIDILVGTQMVTKGFDFDKIALVGVISADGLLSYPDFRSGERGFQLLMQVSGRAGRREKPGQVIVQGFNLTHPVLREVVGADYEGFAKRELTDREFFHYPPYYFLIQLWFRHKDIQITKGAAQMVVNELKAKWGRRIIGPADPSIIRVRNQYQQIVQIKYEKQANLARELKEDIINAKYHLNQSSEFKRVSVSIDVDPY